MKGNTLKTMQYVRRHGIVRPRDVEAAGIPREFLLLLPSICEEGYARLNQMGVTVHSGHIHAKAERPLHHHSHLMASKGRERLLEICKEIRPNTSLGYENMATMVVLYRNSPNSLPAILRGSDKQATFYGLFPRFKDLPFESQTGTG